MTREGEELRFPRLETNDADRANRELHESRYLEQKRDGVGGGEGGYFAEQSTSRQDQPTSPSLM